MDLAQGLVELSKKGEARRSARRQLRTASELVAKAILDQLRTGDAVELPSQDGKPVRYEVARIRWQVTNLSSRTDGVLYSHPAEARATLLRNDAVLVDVRAEYRSPQGHVFAPAGRAVERIRLGMTAVLHLATDDELIAFADEVEVVINAFTGKLEIDVNSQVYAANKLAELKIKGAKR